MNDFSVWRHFWSGERWHSYQRIIFSCQDPPYKKKLGYHFDEIC